MVRELSETLDVTLFDLFNRGLLYRRLGVDGDDCLMARSIARCYCGVIVIVVGFRCFY